MKFKSNKINSIESDVVIPETDSSLDSGSSNDVLTVAESVDSQMVEASLESVAPVNIPIVDDSLDGSVSDDVVIVDDLRDVEASSSDMLTHEQPESHAHMVTDEHVDKPENGVADETVVFGGDLISSDMVELNDIVSETMGGSDEQQVEDQFIDGETVKIDSVEFVDNFNETGMVESISDTTTPSRIERLSEASDKEVKTPNIINQAKSYFTNMFSESKDSDNYQEMTFKQKRDQQAKEYRKKLGAYFMLGLLGVSAVGGAVYTIYSSGQNVAKQDVAKQNVSELDTDEANTAKAIANGSYDAQKLQNEVDKKAKDDAKKQKAEQTKLAEEELRNAEVKTKVDEAVATVQSDMKATLDTITSANSELQSSNEQLTKEVSSLKSENNTLKADKSALESGKTTLEKEKQSVQDELNKKNQYITELEKYIDELEKRK